MWEQMWQDRHRHRGNIPGTAWVVHVAYPAITSTRPHPGPMAREWMVHPKNGTMSSTSNVVVAAMAGAVVGALIGVLLAPASGSETRRNIAKSVSSARDTLAYRVMQAEDMVSKLRHKAGGTAGKKATV